MKHVLTLCGAFILTLGLALTASAESQMDKRSSPMNNIDVLAQIVRQQVYSEMYDYAMQYGFELDDKSIEFSSNAYGVSAIAPFDTEMLDLDFATANDIGVVYYSPGSSAVSDLSGGIYTLRLQKSQDDTLEVQLVDESGLTAHAWPAEVHFGEDELDETKLGVITSIRADEQNTLDMGIASYFCWIHYSGGTSGHYPCTIIIIAA
jgi:hypothetical protein